MTAFLNEELVAIAAISDRSAFSCGQSQFTGLKRLFSMSNGQFQMSDSQRGAGAGIQNRQQETPPWWRGLRGQ